MQHLIELLLGYLSTRIPLTKYADRFVSSEPFAPILPSRPPVQAPYGEQYEKYYQKDEKEFPWKVPTPKGEVEQHNDDEPDRRHEQGSDGAPPGRTAIGLI